MKSSENNTSSSKKNTINSKTPTNKQPNNSPNKPTKDSNSNKKYENFKADLNTTYNKTPPKQFLNSPLKQDKISPTSSVRENPTK